MNIEWNKQNRLNVSHFCSDVLQKAKIKTFFSYFQTHYRGWAPSATFHARTLATYYMYFLKPRRMLFLGKFDQWWPIFYSEQDYDYELMKPVSFLLLLRGEENLINSVVYCNKIKTFEYFNVCTEKVIILSHSFPLIFSEEEKDEQQGSPKVFCRLAIRDRISSTYIRDKQYVNY